VERGREPETGGIRHTLGGADDEVSARRQRVGKARVERVADPRALGLTSPFHFIYRKS
jgi:hypothetical protein